MDALLAGVLARARTILRFGGLSFLTNYDATDIQDVQAGVAERCCALLADRITFIANSNAARAAWAARLGIGQDRFEVVANGVEFAPLLPAPRRAALKAGLFGDPDVVVIGFVGRFQNVKRPGLWIDVALEVARRDPRARFLLVGDGPLRPRLMARVEASEHRGRFKFTGAVPDSLADLYQTMDVLLHTAAMESLPNAVIEAVGHGAFAVAAPVGDIPDILRSSYSGDLVPAADKAGFVRGITAALSRIEALGQDRERRAEEMRRRFGMRAMWARLVRRMWQASQRAPRGAAQT
jgi:glycosyltransferase involved in cell wall biosynthesis